MAVSVMLTFVAAAAASSGRVAAAQPLATFVPEFTPSPSAAPTNTPLPAPVGPPPDARAVQRTTPPLGPSTPAAPPAIAPALWLTAADAIVLPIDVRDDRIFLPAVIDGRHASVMLDSATLATTFDVDALPGRGDGATHTVQIGDLRLTGLTATKGRVRAWSQTYVGGAADALVGQDLLGRYPVSIDYKNRTLTIFRTPQAEASARPAGAAVLPLALVRGLPVVQASIDGSAAVPLVVATALDLDAFVSNAYARRNDFLTTIPELRMTRVGQELRGRTARAQRLTLGPLVFDRPLVGVPDDGFDAAGAGAIGAPLLARAAVVVFDEPSSALIVAAPPGPIPGGTFDRFGLWLVWRQGAVTIRKVLAASPADGAGLREGDQLLQFNGQRVDDLGAARALLSSAPLGMRVVLTIRRGGHIRYEMMSAKALL